MSLWKRDVYVIDTCVLLNDPDIFGNLRHSEIVIPAAVIKELDGLKKHPDPEEPRAKAARKVARALDMLGCHQDISCGARTPSGSVVRISHHYEWIDDLASTADNVVVGTAIKLTKEDCGTVIVLSSDNNVRNITRSYGIRATDYPFGRVRPPRGHYWHIDPWNMVAAGILILIVLYFSTR